MTLSNTADCSRATLLPGGIFAALLLVSPGALAQRSAGDQAAADALYNEARDLLKAGNKAAGCAKFVASEALSPAASTMLNIARCDEQDGKVATAFADYTQALRLNGDTPGVERRKELEALAEQGRRALEPRLPRLRIVITGAPAGVQVQRDREEIPASALGEALPADPGVHQVHVSAPGYREETRAVTLEEGKTAVVEIALQRSAAGGTSGDAPPSRQGPGWSRPAGIALTTVGAVGLVVGAVTGIVSLDKIGAIKSSAGCPAYPRCPAGDAADKGTLSSAETFGNVSTAGIIAGGVLAAAGVVLLVLPTGGARPASLVGSVRVSVGPGRFDLGGSF